MSQLFVIVTIAERKRLVRIEDIREIVPLMALSEVEGRKGNCRGIANLRGEMIPVFDLAGPDARLSPSRVILVTRAGKESVGLLVDDAHDVVTVPRDHVALRPVGAGASATMVRVGDEILSVLEPADVLQSEP